MHKKIHMIGNAHIDPTWLWHWQDGYAEIKATFRSALDRMIEFDDFVFTCACSLYYQWVEENEPDMFEEIRARVAEGRWVIAGGWLIQPDCNIPSGEALARQALYAQRYFYKTFGVRARVGYNVDTFGHNVMLPQIYKHSGIDAYVMMRPQDFELELPYSLFWWQSPDGTKMLTYRIPGNYGTYWGDPDPMRENFEKACKAAEKQDIDMMSFYGVGNHGGGPTIQNIETVHALQQEHGADKVAFSSPNGFFDSVRTQSASLPVLEQELQHHASGCYAAHLRTKQNNRRAEYRLANAEKFSVLAKQLLGGTAYRLSEMNAAWEKVLFNQFHDIMGGCSIRAVYEDVEEFYGYALTIAAETQNRSLQRIAWNIDTMGDVRFPLNRDKDWLTWEKDNLGAPLVVFNPLPHPVTAPIVVDKKLAGVGDEDKNGLPMQIIRSPRSDLQNIWDTVFLADVPAMGYRVFWMFSDKTFPPAAAGTTADETLLTMENRFVSLRFQAHTGYLTAYTDKATGHNLLQGAAAVPTVMDEWHIDTWGHSRPYFNQAIAKFSDATVQVKESGPVRSRIRTINRYGASTLTQDFILYADRPEVHVEAKLMWHERHKLLKLQFPLDTQQPRSFYEIPFGCMERPANGEEEPCQQWVSVCGPDGDGRGRGLALINTGNCSASVAQSTLGMTVVRSPIFAESAGLYMENEGVHDPDCDFMEQGMHYFSYALCPHDFDGTTAFAAHLTKLANAFNQPPACIKETYHPGRLGLHGSIMELAAENVAVTAFKLSEDETAYLLRVHETAGQTVDTQLRLPAISRTVRLTLRPYEIKTLLLPFAAAQAAVEVNFLEQ